jgi:DNA-binding Xre family transcriptional regulator
MSPTTIAAMGKGDGISPKVLERICAALDCQPGDIMEYLPDEGIRERGCK